MVQTTPKLGKLAAPAARGWLAARAARAGEKGMKMAPNNPQKKV